VLETQALNIEELNLLQEFLNTCGPRRVQCSVIRGQEKNIARKIINTMHTFLDRKVKNHW